MQSSLNKEKIIFDTDIGSDIDDSFALGYLLHHPNVELLGVTTVTGEAYNRALLCKMMMDLANKDVPVYCGDDHPLGQQEELQPICHMSNLTEGYLASIEKENAADYLVRIVNENPNEITLVCVAPFTNIAKAILKDKSFGKKLKKCVIMGCKIDQGDALKKVLDWNILCDIKAGEIMLSAEYNELVIFPCDLTNTVYTPSGYLKDNVKGVFAKVLNNMGNNWFDRDHSVFHYHDPMAAVYCVHPEFFAVECGTMSIVHDNTGSYTVWNENGYHKLANSVNKTAFLEELYGVINE